MKKKKIDYDVEYGLTQKQVFHYGQLLLRDICRQYDSLLNDYDICWSLEQELDELKSLVTTIIRLQLDKRLVITDLKLKEEMEKQIQKSQLLNNRDLGGKELSPLNRGNKSVVDKNNFNERRFKNEKFKSRKRRVKTNS